MKAVYQRIQPLETDPMMNFDERDLFGVRRTSRLRRDVYQMSKVFQRIFPSPVLTRERVRLAFAVAVATDVLQLVLGPFGWAFADELLDVAAMILIWRLIGFHPLLLPTFILEFLPRADMLPTWTGCVAIVVALRKRQHATVLPPPGSSM